jgi:hypothetical protein
MRASNWLCLIHPCPLTPHPHPHHHPHPHPHPCTHVQARPYKSDPEISAMTSLVEAYQANNIMEFERILRTNRQTFMEDPFINQYIEDLLRKIRTQVSFGGIASMWEGFPCEGGA